MEKEFLKNNIEKNFIHKNFEEWNKHTIDYLVMLISINKFCKYHDILFLLLNDYIIWYDNNDEIKKYDKLYSLDELTKIKSDLYLLLYNANSNTMNLLEHSVDKELFSEVLTKENTITDSYKERVYINDFGEDDIIINNYFTLDNLLYVIFFIMGILILKYLFYILNNNDPIKNYNEYGINLNDTIFKKQKTNICDLLKSNACDLLKSNSCDLLNNPIINYFLNKLF